MFTPLYPPDYAGGAKQAHLLAKTLKSLYKIPIFVLTGSRNIHSHIVRNKVEGVPVIRCKYKGSSLASKLRLTISFLVQLIKHRKRYDIIHVHSLAGYTLLAVVVAQLLNKKIIAKMTLEGYDDPTTLLSSKLKLIYKILLPKLDAVIATNHHLSTLYTRSLLPTSNLYKIPNGVMLPSTKISNTSRRSINSNLKLLFVGIVNDRKGINFLIPLWKEIRSLPITLKIVGPTKLKDHPDVDVQLVNQLKSFEAENNAYSGKIQLTGQLSQVDNQYVKSDLFLFPSTREGQPNSLLEAQSFGLPALAANRPWAKEIIHHGVTGYVLPMKINAWKDIIENLVHNKNKLSQLSKNASIHAKKFDIDTVAASYYKLYKKITQSTK